MAASSVPSLETVPLGLLADNAGFEGSHTSARTGVQVIRRNGSFSSFDAGKISVAITKAFVAVEGTSATASQRIHDAVEALTRQIVETLSRRADPARAIHIEDIQDQVELALMRSGEQKVARAYVLYREERARERRKLAEQAQPAQVQLHVRLQNGRMEPLNEALLQQEIVDACEGLKDVSAEAVLTELRRNLYDGILLRELGQAKTMAARSLVEREPNYAYVSARLLLNALRDEAVSFVLPGDCRDFAEAQRTAVRGLLPCLCSQSH